MNFLKSLFGNTEQAKKLIDMLGSGAFIIDVRTAEELASGHAEGAVNYPLQEIGAHISEIRKLNKPIILCCASGMRSGRATSFLKGEGIECENGGGWEKLQKIQEGLQR